MFALLMLGLIPQQVLYAQWRCTVHVATHPPADLSDWATHKQTLTVMITNTTGKSADVVFDAQVYKDGALQANTQPTKMRKISVPPGGTQHSAEDIIPFDAVSFHGNVDKIASHTGKLPVGDYSICVALLDAATLKPLTQPDCKNFTMTSYQAPILLQPEDKTMLGKTNRPIFKWTLVSPNYPTPVHYRVEVMEVLQGQTPATAWRVNRPILDKSVDAAQLIGPPDFDLPHQGMQYVWGVIASDDNGNTIGDPNGLGGPQTFLACCQGDTDGNNGIVIPTDTINPDRANGKADSNSGPHVIGTNGIPDSTGNMRVILHPPPTFEQTGDYLGAENQAIRTQTIKLVTPTEAKPATSLTPNFVWELRTPNRKIGIMTYELRLAELPGPPDSTYGIDVTVVWPIASIIVFEQKGIHETSLSFPQDIPPLDSTRTYIWTVTAVDQNGEQVAESPIGAFPAWPSSGGIGPAPNPCMCMLAFPGTSYSPTVCLGQPFPLIWGSFTGGPCTSPTNIWTPATIPTSTGSHPYSCAVSRSGATCSYPVQLMVINPAVPFVDVCGVSTNSYTECCGVQSFNLREITTPPSSTCSPIPSSFFPTNTTYHWFISKGTTVPVGIAYGSPVAAPSSGGSYNFQSPCWYPSTGSPTSGVWYSFSGSSISPNAPGNSSVSALSATGAGVHYYVICHVDFPPGALQTCMPSGYTTNYFQFDMAPNGSMISASVFPTLPNCGNNGQIDVQNVQGGVSPYSLRLNIGTPTTPASYPYLFSGLAAIPPGSGYTLVIKDSHYCFGTASTTVVYTGLFGWAPRPGVPTITTSPLHTHTIPCNGCRTLTAHTGTPDPGLTCLTYSYQWEYFGTSSTAYTDIPGATSMTYDACISGTGAGSYKVRVTATGASGASCNGACRESLPYVLTSLNPPMPIITGPTAICDTVHQITLSATGSALHWSTGETTSTITLNHPNIPGTYTVTSTNASGCTSTASITITSYPCLQCYNCNYTIVPPANGSAFQATPAGVNGSGLPIYSVAIQVNNTSACEGKIQIMTPSMGAAGSLTLPSAVYSVPPGISTVTFQFTTTATNFTGSFSLSFTSLNGFNSSTNCKQPVSIHIP
jgi:hypothetical protein